MSKRNPYLCDDCTGRVVIHVVGSCEECGGYTSTQMNKLCAACAERLNQCERCRVSEPVRESLERRREMKR